MKKLAFALLALTACPKADTEKAVEKAEAPTSQSDLTALEAIRQVHDSFVADCGAKLPSFEGLDKLTLAEDEQEKAQAMLVKIGDMAQECANFAGPEAEPSEADTCNPDCSWCPIKWYWCIENAGACAGGDNKSCCKLGACGGKHHCRQVCKSSCGCDVPPLPPDSGGGGDED